MEMAMPERDMMLEVSSMKYMGMKARRTADRDGEDGNDGRREVPEEEEDHEADDDHFLDQLLA